MMSQRAHDFEIGEICICRDVGEPWWPGVICGYLELEDPFPVDEVVCTKWIFGGFDYDLGTTVPVSRVLKWEEGVPQFSKSMGKQHRYLKTPRKLAIVVAERIRNNEDPFPEQIQKVLSGEEEFKRSPIGVTEVVMTNFVFDGVVKDDETNGSVLENPCIVKKPLHERRKAFFNKHRKTSGSNGGRRLLGGLDDPSMRRMSSRRKIRRSQFGSEELSEGAIRKRSPDRQFCASGFETAEAEERTMEKLRCCRKDRWGGEDFIELRHAIVGADSGVSGDGARCPESFWLNGIGDVSCEACHGCRHTPESSADELPHELHSRAPYRQESIQFKREKNYELPLVIHRNRNSYKVCGAVETSDCFDISDEMEKAEQQTVKSSREDSKIDYKEGQSNTSDNVLSNDVNFGHPSIASESFGFFVFPPPFRSSRRHSDTLPHTASGMHLLPREGVGNLILGYQWMVKEPRLAIAGGYVKST